MTTSLSESGVHSAETRRLLLAGVAAGPLYVLVGVLQVLLRPGFDIRRHALSLMSNGSFGWVQVGNFILTGCLVIAGAIGLRRALSGRGANWGPPLLVVYGVGLVGAGFFVADPMDGFPLGTPAGPPVAPTWHGGWHFIAGGIGFFALIAACIVFSRRFASLRRPGWAIFSALTGVGFFAAFAGIASGSKQPAIIPLFTAAVILTWVWLSLLCSFIRRGQLGRSW